MTLRLILIGQCQQQDLSEGHVAQNTHVEHTQNCVEGEPLPYDKPPGVVASCGTPCSRCEPLTPHNLITMETNGDSVDRANEIQSFVDAKLSEQFREAAGNEEVPGAGRFSLPLLYFLWRRMFALFCYSDAARRLITDQPRG